ncbi:ribonuclease HII [Acuticoccus sediminis]|uniref:Ribonuclease HII n=1 Tax=Acuticoccus sediminis TaxID=2184697 RepID=A0A8B2NLT8_9HYPH|nr:ribonuclease HII [Acuticoccus sediminis]RAI00557.1 ribonuclease HII [Acuticoccus sediminis]
MALTPARHRSLSRYEKIVCGVDEAGRGPWAGPVVVAAVILPRDMKIEGVADSKILSHKVRTELFDYIAAEAMVSTVVVSARRVDEMNIRAATLWGMRKAVATLPVRPSVALIDGRDMPDGLCVPGRPLVGGDGRSSAIAAASIVAKVTRDRLMIHLAKTFPRYGFERHKGYGTPEHREALATFGPSIHHRRSFAPVRACFAPEAMDGLPDVADVIDDALDGPVDIALAGPLDGPVDDTGGYAAAHPAEPAPPRRGRGRRGSASAVSSRAG